MITYQVKKGTTDVSVVIRIIDSTDGTPETGVEHNTSGIDLEYRREGAVSTDITEAALAALTTAHTDGGIEHIGNGYYRLDLPDAACASGVDGVLVHGTITGMVVIGCYIQLTDTDIMDGVRGGMTALPNAAADAAGGLPISDAGGLDLDTQLAETDEITAARMATLTDWINGGRLDLLLDAIPTTAMRGTDNAALASEVTAARMSELDAGTGGKMANQVDIIQTDTTTDIPALIATAQSDLDTITGADGATIAGASEDSLVDKVWDEVLTGATHNVATSAGRRLRALQDSGAYALGAVWIDTVGGTAGTTDFENGTVTNPVDSIADAKTIADSVGLKRFYMIAGSNITLAATFSSYEFIGNDWTLALGGQACDNTFIQGAVVSGIYTGTPNFVGCTLGAITGPGIKAGACGITGTITQNAAGDNTIHDCYSEVAGATAPIFDLGAAVAGTTNVNIRNYSGGWDFRNVGAAGTDVMSVEGRGKLTFNANCAGGVCEVRGLFHVVNNGSTTLTEEANYNATNVNTEADTALTDYGANTTTPPTVAAIRAEMDSNSTQLAALITAVVTNAAGADVATDVVASKAVVDAIKVITDQITFTAANQVDANALAISGSTDAANKLEASAEVIITGAAEAGTLSTTQMTTNLTEATDDHYNGRTVIWTSGVLLGQASDITGYTGATGMLTYTAVTEAPSATDTFVIV